jgi:hypothetical protein
MTNEELKSYFPNMHRHIKEADFNCGVAFERERIINLLQEIVYSWDGFLEIDSKITTMTQLADWLTKKDNE